MEIQGLSTAMTQGQIQQEAAVSVQAMAINSGREQAENLAQIMNSANVISDPARGNYLDLEI
jgi:hypothetical protein